MATHTPTDWFSTADIESYLRSMAGKDVQLSGGWACEQFEGGRGESLGVWRVSGMMTTPSGDQPWSMVIKGWDCTDQSGVPSTFNWPWREAELYRSHTLHDLPGVSAPTCFGSVERDGAIWVWLEDLTDAVQPEWMVERYAIAARHLGQMNGAYLSGRPLPDHLSLSQRWLDGWTYAATETMAHLDDYLDHPFVRGMLPPDVTASYIRIWDQRHETLAALRMMPHTFSHLDAFPPNIFFRFSGGDEEMVLIDWSFAGPAAVGEELAALCVVGPAYGSLLDIIDEIEHASFAAYIEGLRDAGWRGDEADVWRSYRLAATLRYGPALLRPLLAAVTNDGSREALSVAMGVRSDLLQAHLAEMCRWIADRGDDT